MLFSNPFKATNAVEKIGKPQANDGKGSTYISLIAPELHRCGWNDNLK